MGRKEELDAMDEVDKQKELLAMLDKHGTVRIDTRPALGFWGYAVDRLQETGKVVTEFMDLPEQQYSFLELRLK